MPRRRGVFHADMRECADALRATGDFEGAMRKITDALSDLLKLQE